MGGGKTKTVTEFDSGGIFKGNENLMFKDMLRFYADGNKSGINLTKALIENSFRLFNYHALDAFGVIYKYDLVSSRVTDAAMLSYIKTHVDPSAETINSFTITGATFPRFENHLNLSYPYVSGSVAFSFAGVSTTSNVYDVAGVSRTMVQKTSGSNTIPDTNAAGEVALANTTDPLDIVYDHIPSSPDIYYITTYSKEVGQPPVTVTNKVFVKQEDVDNMIEHLLSNN